jgi:hypothetical protein
MKWISSASIRRSVKGVGAVRRDIRKRIRSRRASSQWLGSRIGLVGRLNLA